MTHSLVLALLTTLAMTPLSAHGAECGEAGDEAAAAEQWQTAERLYLESASEPRCAGKRAILLYNAALARATALGTATPHGAATRAERCALAARFRDAIDAGLPREQAADAERERADAALNCLAVAPPTGAPPDAGRGAEGIAAPTPAPVPSPDELIADAMPRADAGLEALSGRAAPPADDAAYLLLGAAGLTAVGAGVAYAILVAADAERDQALQQARASVDESVWRSAEARHEAANDRATTAGLTAYGLLGATVLFGTWGVIRLVVDDDAGSASLPLAQPGLVAR